MVRVLEELGCLEGLFTRAIDGYPMDILNGALNGTLMDPLKEPIRRPLRSGVLKGAL